MSPAVPSKGGRLLYMYYSSHVDIWRRDLLHPKAAAVKMIASTIDQTAPNYSPDGKHIAFCSKRGGEWGNLGGRCGREKSCTFVGQQDFRGRVAALVTGQPEDSV